MRKVIWFVYIITIVMIGTATALPEFLDVFDTKYNMKGLRLDSCDVCHIQGKPQRSLYEFIPGIIFQNKNLVTELQMPNNLNIYGSDFQKNLNNGVSMALSIIEPLDSDNDKVSNIDEINNLTFPGDKKDKGGESKNRNNPLTQVKDVINTSAIKNYQPP